MGKENDGVAASRTSKTVRETSNSMARRSRESGGTNLVEDCKERL